MCGHNVNSREISNGLVSVIPVMIPPSRRDYAICLGGRNERTLKFLEMKKGVWEFHEKYNTPTM